MGQLTIQDNETEVFVFCEPDPACHFYGSRLGRVFPGGHFHGLHFDLLKRLGTGVHAIEIDGTDSSSEEVPPIYESDLQRERANFRFKLFAYTRGYVFPGQLIEDAFEFAGVTSVEDLLAEWPPDHPISLADKCLSPPEKIEEWHMAIAGTFSFKTDEDRAAHERYIREKEDRSRRGYCKLYEHFHMPRKD